MQVACVTHMENVTSSERTACRSKVRVYRLHFVPMNPFQGFVFTPPNDLGKVNNDATSNQQSNDQSDQVFPDPTKFTVDWQALSQQFTQTMITNGSDERQMDRQDQFRTFRNPMEYRSLSDTQTIRRSRALALQKKNRTDRTTQARKLALEVAIDEENDDEEEEEHEASSLTIALKRSRDFDEEMTDVNKLFRMEIVEDEKKKRQREKKALKYANQLMYAETMEDIPQDLLENWSMVICPVGKRCLVTSGNGREILIVYLIVYTMLSIGHFMSLISCVGKDILSMTVTQTFGEVGG
ncbi:hypothetical protein EC973_000582 [Apophysomyces ossiformis]|uniref:Snurportin-1 n=1 Tax=Apophysomyces ossiformis TaxID=679940 RepID=A0A8H7BIX9_9FUNG|nr:hypothetical protein EC973_000582 [Apophysomyces ossiformis]